MLRPQSPERLVGRHGLRVAQIQDRRRPIGAGLREAGASDQATGTVLPEPGNAVERAPAPITLEEARAFLARADRPAAILDLSDA
ncbi:MAG: hypothetical protein AAFO79_08005, partial [Pseudomonadota bacterium]